MQTIVSPKFEKVSFQQFETDMCMEYPYFELEENKEELKNIYDNIKLPIRSTDNSCGYDWFSPFEFMLSPGNSIYIPTGIRVDIDPGWWMLLCPKSGLGSEFHMKFDNTIGVDDADYYYADNEGHIKMHISIPYVEMPDQINYVFRKPLNTRTPSMEIAQGQKLFQSIFLPYGITANDHETPKKKRVGGHGSTGKF